RLRLPVARAHVPGRLQARAVRTWQTTYRLERLGKRSRRCMSERLLNASEVAELLNVPVSWVREATRAERLPHLKLGRYRRYQPAAIQAWLRDHRAGPVPPSPGRGAADLPNEGDPSL